MNNSKTIILNYHEIIDLIPHRYPFLLIDRVEEIIANDNELYEEELPCEFELGTMKITINKLQTYEKELILCKGQ